MMRDVADDDEERGMTMRGAAGHSPRAILVSRKALPMPPAQSSVVRAFSLSPLAAEMKRLRAYLVLNLVYRLRASKKAVNQFD